MQLVEVVLYVRDMERAIRFYRDTVGLALDFESEGWTTLHTGACTLALHATAEREPGRGEPDPTFLVAHVVEERARLAGLGDETCVLASHSPIAPRQRSVIPLDA